MGLFYLILDAAVKKRLHQLHKDVTQVSNNCTDSERTDDSISQLCDRILMLIESGVIA